MDSSNPRGLDPTYRLLALCARAEGHPALYAELTRQLENFTNWDQLSAQAEAYGMAPLFWHHFHQSGAPIPAETARLLKGLYLRHRRNNQIHAQALLEIVELFKPKNIQPLVLKGLALAYGYYPEPALRPISDIDLLFKRDEILPALDLLKAAGFSSPPLQADLKLLPKELTADSPPRDGIRVHVELHHHNPLAADEEFKDFDDAPQLLKVEQGIILVPSPTDTIDYLSRHFERHLFEARTDKPVQLKWIADIISLVERHAESLDWAHETKLLNRLEVFYSLTPLPEKYARLIPVRQIAPPEGVNRYPQGWPREKFEHWKTVGFWRFLGQTFRPPSEWWLRLYHGVGPRSTWWYGQIAHRMRIIQRLFWLLIRKMGMRQTVEH